VRDTTCSEILHVVVKLIDEDTDEFVTLKHLNGEIKYQQKIIRFSELHGRTLRK